MHLSIKENQLYSDVPQIDDKFAKQLGCFNPNLGQICTNPNVGLKMSFKILTQFVIFLITCLTQHLVLSIFDPNLD